jgi:hypothetical protein
MIFVSQSEICSKFVFGPTWVITGGAPPVASGALLGVGDPPTLLGTPKSNPSSAPAAMAAPPKRTEEDHTCQNGLTPTA